MGTELMKVQSMLRRLAVLLLLVCATTTAQAAPEIERFITPAGIEVWLVREASIPMIALQATGAAARRSNRRGRRDWRRWPWAC